jgi:hypothetical protein
MAGEFGMSDRDLFEAFGAPDISVHTDGAKVEARHAQRLGAHLGVPAIEAPEIEVWIAVGQAASLDRMSVIDQKEKDVPVRGVEGGGILGHFHERIVGHAGPVEQTGHLPAGVAHAIPSDLHHRAD